MITTCIMCGTTVDINEPTGIDFCSVKCEEDYTQMIENDIAEHETMNYCEICGEPKEDCICYDCEKEQV